MDGGGAQRIEEGVEEGGTGDGYRGRPGKGGTTSGPLSLWRLERPFPEERTHPGVHRSVKRTGYLLEHRLSREDSVDPRRKRVVEQNRQVRTTVQQDHVPRIHPVVQS